MADMTNRRELADRLEAAECGSRELDAAIWQAFCPRQIEYGLDRAKGLWPRNASEEERAARRANYITSNAPTYTTSLDAALALAERLGLDGWRMLYGAMMHWKAHDPRGPLSRELPLALCATILRARLDDEGKGGDNA